MNRTIYHTNEPTLDCAVASSDNFDLDDISFDSLVIPSSFAEAKEQIAISEKQISEGHFVTAREAISHFYQL